MNFDFMLHEFLGRLERNSPALIVLIICLMMTFSQWRRHPRAARWAVIAFGWFLFVDLLALFWYSIGIWLVITEIRQPREAEWVSWIGEAALSCLEGLGYVFVILTLNEARKPYRPPEFYDDPADYEERLKAVEEGSFTAELPKQTDVKQNEP